MYQYAIENLKICTKHKTENMSYIVNLLIITVPNYLYSYNTYIHKQAQVYWLVYILVSMQIHSEVRVSVLAQKGNDIYVNKYVTHLNCDQCGSLCDKIN